MRLKIVLTVIVAVVLVAVAGLLFLSTQVDGIVARTVVEYARETTGTAAHLGGVDIILGEGRGALKDLTIDNPDGYETSHFLRIDDIETTLELGSLRTDVPVVKEVLVSGAHLNAEQRGDSINLADIQRYMSQSAEPSAEDEGRIIIDRFRLTNGHVTVTSEYLDKPEELALEDVVVNGVGRTSGGATYSEATEAVLTPIVRAARSAAEGRLRAAAAGRAREEIQDAAKEKLEELINK
jgi:uncharacterized protein involved in outer membrane biogenesis